MALIEVTDRDFVEKVMRTKVLVLVGFYTDCCCGMTDSVLRELNRNLGDNVMIAKLNVDENPETVSNQEVISVPTMKLFKEGSLVAMMIGLHAKNDLEKIIKEYM
ncbi:thioredoxin 1 [Paenibacillus taihuensis]|uniref:Thioredoxin n=1 Tax=Paenibacillus taihuensis TaxID=1156355 RepID=A0A3D9SGU2_9BACL|nr:thioredoxin domain-containing protein [Paenibacillus taihuensis]REE91495.1 thioredoxin 1 [Paenibacillus taihuensis]